MIKILDNNYSTTRLCYKLLDDKYLDENGKIKEEYKFKLNFPEFGIVDSKISAKENEKFDTYLFLPEGEGRKGEGGIRTKGYFKFSYKKVDSEWYVVGSNSEKIKLPTINYPLQTTYYPLITIITVVYNGEKYLEETILSVINQTYPNVEYIIIDGGSTDGTLDIIKKYEDKIDYWVSEKDNGIYDAMNKGIDLANNNSFLLFLNAGDTFVNNEIIYNIVKGINKNIKIIYGNADIYNENKFFLTTLKALKFNKKNLNCFATRTVCHQSIFVHKSIVPKYSLQFRLKDELNWYYDLEKNIKQNEIKYVELSISNYLLGGEGDRYFWENMKERVAVMKKHNNFIKFILNFPFVGIPLIFRLRRKIIGK